MQEREELYLDRRDIGVLSNIFKLIEAFLGHFALSQIDAELNETEHDGFKGLQTGALGTLRDDNLVQRLQGSLIFANGDEF
jgi:hypothetical protein